ncbi:MAG: zinc ribbon-containing protein [Lachnospiraceae bacterium]|nr:zinc ribbon-containing protein [Lachnospiraceae bacterium]
MKVCEHCGKEIYHAAAICHHCGNKVETETEVIEEKPVSDVSDKTLGIIAYITLIGFILALVLSNGRERSEFLKLQLSQALIITLCHIGGIMVPLVGWVLLIVVFFAWASALIFACQGKTKPLPVIGEFRVF